MQCVFRSVYMLWRSLLDESLLWEVARCHTGATASRCCRSLSLLSGRPQEEYPPSPPEREKERERGGKERETERWRERETATKTGLSSVSTLLCIMGPPVNPPDNASPLHSFWGLTDNNGSNCHGWRLYYSPWQMGLSEERCGCQRSPPPSLIHTCLFNPPIPTHTHTHIPHPLTYARL